jgi:hypothetical protein
MTWGTSVEWAPRAALSVRTGARRSNRPRTPPHGDLTLARAASSSGPHKAPFSRRVGIGRFSNSARALWGLGVPVQLIECGPGLLDGL